MITPPQSQPDSVSRENAGPRNLYQCGTCSQSYSRIDHLRRHVLSHTREKPHQCPVCNKRFGRIDLLRRHSTLHTAAGNRLSTRRAATGGTSCTPRASQACSACAENHLKCDEEKPCTRCCRRNIPCVVPSKFTDRAQAHSADLCIPDATGTVEDHPQVACTWPQELDFSQPAVFPEDGHIPVVRSESTNPMLTDGLSGIQTPRGMINFGLQTDLDFSLVDLSFLESYNTQVPFEFDDQAYSVSASGSPYDPHETASQTKPRRAWSMQRLRWRFIPDPRDHGYCEHENLLLPNGATGAPSLATGIPQEPHDRLSDCESIDIHNRDKILGIVLNQMKQPISAVLSSFPSVELLGGLIRYYLTSPFSAASTWIHRPTFQPKQACPELLLAMAAAGAVLTPDPALRKLGFAMQEVVRLQLPTVFEGNNATIRDLHLHQAYLLYLEIGIWSGNSRKIEICEAFRHPLLTMVRRGGRFHQSAYAPLAVRLEDSSESLEDTWRGWAHNEAYKRLIYRLFRLEAQVSMALFTAPSIAYAEMGPPLPAPLALWTASSASLWKEAYQSLTTSTTSRTYTLSECVANLDLLEISRETTDLRLASCAVLHSIWGLVWEYRQLSTLLAGHSRYWDNDLLMTSRHAQLIKVLRCFRMAYGDEAPVQLNFIMMHMNVSLEEIENLATSDEPSQAWEQPALRDWFSSEQSRHAIWYAGQVVGAIKSLPPQALRDFMAIALYHASLILWAYGLASSHILEPDGQELAGPALQQKVYLDGPEGENMQRFIALQHGLPVLQGLNGDEGMISIRDTEALLGGMIQIMQQRHIQENVHRAPPLVDNLIHLLQKLRDASGWLGIPT
ncbi:hypothetical protein BDV09DRAFT_196055 [Aspergillus tetrazonus]